jgi:hypothetical protein
MTKAFEKRLLRLENKIADRERRKTAVCNCRGITRFHNANCLEATLKAMRRNCPVHYFRELGSFWWTPSHTLLVGDDNEFCPCPPHPWRAFQLKARLLQGPQVWEARHKAEEAWELHENPPYNLEQDNKRADEVMSTYLVARQQWIASGGKLPGAQEIAKLEWQRWGKSKR